MEKLTLDVEKLAVESVVTGAADDACPAASAGGGTTTPVLR